MVMVEVFSLILGMSIPWCGKIGKGIFPRSGEATIGEIKISPGVTKGTFYFPQEWLSRIGEEKFPQERWSRDWGNENFPRSGEAATGEIFLHHDC